LVNWLTELLILLFALVVLLTKPTAVRLPFIPKMFLFLLIGISSALANSTFSANTIFSLRLVFRFYLFFLIMVNLSYSSKDLKALNVLIFILFLIQIPVAVIKLSIYGQGEMAIGTYAVHGGTLSTAIPLVAIGFLVGLYFLYRRKAAFLLLIIGFIAFSIIGGKRAFVFYFFVLSFFLFSLLLLQHRFSEYLTVKNIKWGTIAFILPLIIITSLFCLKFVPTLNPEREQGGSFDLDHALSFAKQYTTRQMIYDPTYSGGRFATTKLVVETLVNHGILKLCFGYGPGAQTETRFSSRGKPAYFSDMKIGYGITPLSFLLIEYGLLGALTYLYFMASLFFMCAKFWKSERDPYWKAISFGSVAFAFTMIMLWFSYGKSTLTGDTLPLIFYYFMGVAYIRLRSLYGTELPTYGMQSC
jgi:hypothetical protein